MIFKKPTVVFDIIIPVALGILFLYTYLHNIRKAGEIGLGTGTFFYMPVYKNYPIEIMTLQLADSLEKGWQSRGNKELSLWFGNSQLNGINQYKEGNKNCIAFIFDSIQKYKKEVLGINFANANLQEFLVSILYMTQKMPVKNIILPVFYDDMREDGIRNEINVNDVVQSLKSQGLYDYYDSISSVASLKITNGSTTAKGDDMKALDNTAQEVSERYLDHLMDSSWRIWAERGNFRGNIFNDLYRFRNLVMGIKATTVRNMIPGRYNNNYHAFLKIIKYCKDKGITIFVYIPPLRNDVKPPYSISGYNDFKASIQKDCVAGGAFFLNLENLVPAKYWGKKGTTTFGAIEELDFMHFQEPGHRDIADTIYKTLISSP